MVEPRICEEGTGDKSNPSQNETGAVERLLQETAKRTASLAAVEVCLERRSQLLCALPLLVQSTSTLSGGGLASVSSSTVGLVSVGSTEHTELLILDDSRVVCVDHDDFVELVLTVLANPVRVENFEVREVTCNTLFGHALCVLGHGDLLDTGLGWLTLHVNLALSQSTTADAGADENNALLGFVSE